MNVTLGHLEHLFLGIAISGERLEDERQRDEHGNLDTHLHGVGDRTVL